MPQNPLNALLDAPQKRKEINEAMKQLKLYVSEYNGAVDRLRINQPPHDEHYSDNARKKDMQIMIDAVEKMKRLKIPTGLYEKAKKNVHADNEWKYMLGHYNDFIALTEGKKKPQDIFNEVGLRFPVPLPTITAYPTASPDEPKKTGWFSKITRKLSDWTADFTRYMKEHPIRGSLLIGAAIVGIAVIIATSVVTGGAAGVVATGTMATLIGGGVTALVGGILFGGAIVAFSAGALAYDVNKHAVMEREMERLAKASKTAVTAAQPSKIAPESPQQPAWKKSIPPIEDKLHNLNNEEQRKENMATTTGSRATIKQETEASDLDDRESESPHM